MGLGTIAANLENSISGTVKNFMDGDTPIDATWSVTLQKAGTTGFTVDDSVFDGVTEGDKGMMGTWNGQFFGAVTRRRC